MDLMDFMRRYCYFALCILTMQLSSYGQGLIVNEVSQGTGGLKEWVELVVVGSPCATVDIRGWVIDDNNGLFTSCPPNAEHGALAGVGLNKGHIRFKNHADWAEVPVGTVILLYAWEPGVPNAQAEIFPLTVDYDDADCDFLRVVPINAASFAHLEQSNTLPIFASGGSCAQNRTCPNGTATPGNPSYGGTYVNVGNQSFVGNISIPVSGVIGLRNGGDAFQVRNPSYAYFHGFSWGSGDGGSCGMAPTLTGGPDNLHISATGAANNAYQFQNIISDDYRVVGNFAKVTASTSQSPGEANSCANAQWIASLRYPPDDEFSDGSGACVTSDPTTYMVCEGETIDLELTGCESDTYSWISNNTSIVSISGMTTTQSTTILGVSVGTTTVDVTAILNNTNLGTFAGCPLTTEETYSFTVEVTPADVPTLSPIGSFCESDMAVGLNISQDGYTGSWSGLGVTGNTFDPRSAGSGGSPHTLTFTPDPMQCAIANTLMVVVLPNVTPILTSLGPFCDSDLSFPLITTQDGINGNWSGPGVTGNAFDPGTAGAGGSPHTLTFTPLAGQCASPNSMMVTVEEAPDAGTNGTLTLCEGDALSEAILLGSLGGTPDGGETWSPGVPGTAMADATYTYTVSGISPCMNAMATVMLTVNTPPDAGTNGALTLCAGDGLSEAILFDELGGTPDGGGTWSPGVPGTATADDTYTYTVTGTSPCLNASAMVQLIVHANPDVDDITDVVMCNSYTLPAITGTNLSGNEAYWTGPNGTGTQYIAGQMITADITLFIYDESGTMPNCSDEESFMIDITPPPSLDAVMNVIECGSYTLPTITGMNLTGSESYYDGPGGTGMQYTVGQSITSSIGTMYIYNGMTGCEDEESFSITINTSPDIDDITDVVMCNSYTLPAITGTNLSGNEAYWTGPNGTGTQYIAGQMITADITLFINDDSGTMPNCSDEESFNITIAPPPDLDPVSNVISCDLYVLPVITGSNLTGGQLYYDGPGGIGTSFGPGQVITSSIATLFVYDGTVDCDDEESFSITINSTPVIDDMSNVTACQNYTLPLITGFNLTGNEAYYTAPNGGGMSFSSGQVITNDITLFIYDETGTTPNCADDESFTITINEPPNLDVPPNVSECDLYILPGISGSNLTGSENYFSGPGGTGIPYFVGQMITSTIPVIYVYDGVLDCGDEESFSITIFPSPSVEDILDQTICDSYQLPMITGLNLSGNESYWTQSGGMGNKFFAGQMITSSQTLFIYDETGSMPNCFSEESFSITINISPDVDDLSNVAQCESYELPPITGINLTGSESYWTGPNGTGMQLSPGDMVTEDNTLFIYNETGTSPNCSGEEIFFVAIFDQPNAGVDVSSSVCEGIILDLTTVLSGADVGGVFTDDSGTRALSGNNFNTTGLAGATYQFTYELTAQPPCLDDKSILMITVVTSVSAGNDNSESTCKGNMIDLFTLLDGADAGGSFTDDDGTGALVGSVFNTTGFGGGSFDFSYNIGDGVICPEDEAIITVNVFDNIDINNPGDVAECGSYILPTIVGVNLTGGEAYFDAPMGMGNQYDAGDMITVSITLYLYDSNRNCEDQEELNISITDSPLLDNPGNQQACGSYTLPLITGSDLTGAEAYYDAPLGMGNQYTEGNMIFADVTLYIYDGAPGCDDETSFIVDINDLPDIDGMPNVVQCGQYILPDITGTNLTGNESFWSQSGGAGTQYLEGDIISGDILLYIYDGVVGCEDQESFTIDISPAPEIIEIADLTECDEVTLPIITGSNLTGNESYWTMSGGTGIQYFDGDLIDANITLYLYDGFPSCDDQDTVSIAIATTSTVDDLADVIECGQFILPEITGTNLSGNEAYYDITGGAGIMYLEGDVITSSILLFIYDGAAGCDSEESVSIVINLPIDELFTITTSYCIDDTPDVLPGTSDNGITGTWLPTSIATDAAGMSDYIFTPDADQCANSYTLTVTINDCNCIIDIPVVSNIQCDDNGTDTDPSDDIYTFDIIVTGTNLGSGWTADDTNFSSGNYDVVISLGPYAISDGALSFVIEDVGDSDCFIQVDVPLPRSCSDNCQITVLSSEIGICDDNNTGTIDSDDIYNVTINVDESNTAPGSQYTVTWNAMTRGPFDYNTDHVITGLPADGSNITLTIVDASGNCQTTLDVTQVSCSSCDQTVDAGTDQTIDCSTPEVTIITNLLEIPTTYNWTGPSGFTNDQRSFITSTDGTYCVTVTFDNFCTATDCTAVIAGASLPVADPGANQTITCTNLMVTLGGPLTTTGSGITYEWKDEAGIIVSTDQFFTSNILGTYFFQVINGGCASTIQSVTVIDGTTVPSAVIYTDPGNVINCLVSSVLLTTDEETDVTYTWILTDGSIEADSIIILVGGEVILVALDTITGCNNQSAIQIGDFIEYPIIDIASVDPLTCTIPTTTINATASQSGTSIVYQWYDSNFNPIVGGTSSTLDVASPDTYYFEARDGDNGCTNVDTVIVLSEIDYPLADAGENVTIRCSDTDISLNGTGSEMGSTIHYNWSSLDGNNIISGNTTIPSVDEAGWYFLEVSNGDNGCASIDSVLVQENMNMPEVDEIIVLHPSCFGDTGGVIDISIMGGTPEYQYSINGGAFTSGSTFSNIGGGTYDIVVEDQDGCVLDTSIVLTAPQELTLEIIGDFEIDLGESTILEGVTNISASEIASIEWTPADNLNCPGCLITEANPGETTLYLLTLIDANGCEISESEVISVSTDVDIFVPTIFSPNGDQVNDNFTVFSKDNVREIKRILIFDRWGERVFSNFDFQSNDPSLGWDGSFEGVNVVQGVYVYLIEYKLINGQIRQLIGDVTIVR